MENLKLCYKCGGEFHLSEMKKGTKEQVCIPCGIAIRKERRAELHRQSAAKLKARNEETAQCLADKKAALEDSLYYPTQNPRAIKVSKLNEALDKAETRRINKENREFIGL